MLSFDTMFLLLFALALLAFSLHTRSTKALRRLNQVLLEGAKVSKIGFWEFDAKTGGIEWSEGVYDIFEVDDKKSVIDYEKFLSFLPPKDKEALTKEFQDSAEQKRDYFITHQIITAKVRIKYVEERATHTFDKKGNLIKSIGSVYDITERYLSQMKYKVILDLASDGIFLMNHKGKLVDFSQRACELLGYTPEEMKTLSVYDWDKELTPADFPKIKDSFVGKYVHFDRIHTRKDGSTYIADVMAAKIIINGEFFIYASARDVTAQKAVQKRLEDSEFRWKFAVDGNNDGLWDWNIKTDEVFFSAQWKKMLGFQPDEIESSLQEWQRRVHPEDVANVYQDIEDYFEGKTPTYRNRHRVLSKDGSYKWILDRGVIVERDGEGKPARMIGTHSDITHLKAQEQKMIDTKNELEAIFETTLEGIALLDLSGNYIKFNKKYTELLGYSEEELRELNCFDLTLKKYQPKLANAYKEVLQKGSYENFERECRTKDNTIKRFKSSIALMPNKQAFLMTTVDYTELYDAYALIGKQANEDELTKLDNRKSYNEHLANALKAFSHHRAVFSIVLFDIDDFKEINDNYGHSMGDSVLVEFGRLIKRQIKPEDTLFRVGGEEFILLTPTPKKSAIVLAEKLRHSVEKQLRLMDEKTVSVSVGVSEVKRDDTNDSIFRRVDKNLYEAKRNGKNRVIAHH